MTPTEFEGLKVALRRQFTHLGERWGNPRRSGVVGVRCCSACGKRPPGHLVGGVCDACFRAGAALPDDVEER